MKDEKQSGDGSFPVFVLLMIWIVISSYMMIQMQHQITELCTSIAAKER